MNVLLYCSAKSTASGADMKEEKLSSNTNSENPSESLVSSIATVEGTGGSDIPLPEAGTKPRDETNTSAPFAGTLNAAFAGAFNDPLKVSRRPVSATRRQLTLDGVSDSRYASGDSKGPSCPKHKLSATVATSTSPPYAEWDTSHAADWMRSLGLYDQIPEQ